MELELHSANLWRHMPCGGTGRYDVMPRIPLCPTVAQNVLKYWWLPYFCLASPTGDFLTDEWQKRCCYL